MTKAPSWRYLLLWGAIFAWLISEVAINWVELSYTPPPPCRCGAAPASTAVLVLPDMRVTS